MFRGGTILTIDADHRVLAGDVATRDGAIVQVGGSYTPQTDDFAILDCAGCVVMPGLVQAHVHTCQTLARGRADDLELMDWLRDVIWPYEAKLDEPAMTACGRARRAPSCCSAGPPRSSTWAPCAIPTRSSRRRNEAALRATIGKAMMDAPDTMPGLRETTQASLDESGRARHALARRRGRPAALRVCAEVRAVVHRRAVARGRRAGDGERARRAHPRERERRRGRAGARAVRQAEHRRARRFSASPARTRASRTASTSRPTSARCSPAAARTCALPVVEPEARVGDRASCPS